MDFNERISQYLFESREETLELLKTLCQIPAPSGKENARAEFVYKWLKGVGATDVYIDDALNVVCPISCENANEIVVFSAHTDIVFDENVPLFFRHIDDKYFCAGIGDDTTCLAQLLIITKYIIESNLTAKTGILVVANSCEEGLGNLKGIKKICEQYGSKIKEFYTFDGQYNAVVNKCVGSHRYEIVCKTRGGHSFADFGNTNAIAVLADFVNRIYNIKVPKVEQSNTTYNVGCIEGGTSVNSICQSAKLLFEYRSDNEICLNKMKSIFNSIVEDIVNKYDAEICVNLIGDRPCASGVDACKLLQITNRVIGICTSVTGVDCNQVSGSTDCNIPMSLKIPSVCVGTYLGGGAHTTEEFVYVESILHGLEIVARVILDYFD